MSKQIHVVMVPWSAFGHMIPFFHLSLALAKAGIKVSYISTPRNIQRLPQVPPSLSSLLNFIGFPLQNLGNDDVFLPEGAEATVEIPFEKIPYLKAAQDLLRIPFKKFVLEQKPDYVIHDNIPYWAAEIAVECLIPAIYFSVFSASTYVMLGHPFYRFPSPESLTSPPEWVDFPSSLAFPRFMADGCFIALHEENASGIADGDRISKSLQACQVVAIRSCPEYEEEYLSVLQKILKKKVIPLGLLPPERPNERSNLGEEWAEIFGWLDRKDPGTVVFVGFGSECKLSKEQLYEIAYGLELSELPFLWALRKPDWAGANGFDSMPPGFSSRTHGRGIVQVGWAPQLEILSHASIGGSLFHSGWGSVIETLQFGHSLILLPFIVDQPLNARVLMDKGLAVEVERKEGGSFSRQEIAQALKLAMASEEGESRRIKAREAAKVFGDQKLHEAYLGSFIEYLKKGVKD